MEKITKAQFTAGAAWKLIESFSAKGISFIVSVVLARILMPQDYGVIALTSIFINLSDIFIEGGFSTTLVRKKSVDNCDYCCSITVSLTIALVLYGVFFFLSPYIATYYSEPELKSVLRVISITLFMQAFYATRTIIINRNMQYKLLCYCNIVGSTISGIIGIIAAYMGLGVWALVIQRLLQQVLITILLFLKIKWKIYWEFSLSRLIEIVKFSIGVVSASLLYYIGGNMYGFVIGKQYSVADLGYYSKGCQLPEQISLYTFFSISTVLLPTLSSCQDDTVRFKHIVRKVTNMTSYLIFPMMIGLIVISEEVIVFLLTSKWLPAVNIMRGWCIYYMAMPFTLINSQIFYALGYSFTRVKTEIIRIIFMTLGLIIFVFIYKSKIEILSMISAGAMVLSALFTSKEVSKYINYSMKEILTDIWKPFVSSCIMAVVVVMISIATSEYFELSNLIQLTIKIFFGSTSYLLMSYLFKMTGHKEVFAALKKLKIERVLNE